MECIVVVPSVWIHTAISPSHMNSSLVTKTWYKILSTLFLSLDTNESTRWGVLFVHNAQYLKRDSSLSSVLWGCLNHHVYNFVPNIFGESPDHSTGRPFSEFKSSGCCSWTTNSRSKKILLNNMNVLAMYSCKCISLNDCRAYNQSR